MNLIFNTYQDIKDTFGTRDAIYSILSCCSNPQKYTFAKHYFCYLKDKNTYTDVFKSLILKKEQMKNKKPSREVRVSVICIETQQIFNSIKQAKVWLGKGDIASCLMGVQHTAGGYHWAYLDDKEKQENLKGFIGKERDFSNYKIFGYNGKEKLNG